MKIIIETQKGLTAEQAEKLMKIGRKTNSKSIVHANKPSYPQPRKSKKVK